MRGLRAVTACGSVAAAAAVVVALGGCSSGSPSAAPTASPTTSTASTSTAAQPAVPTSVAPAAAAMITTPASSPEPKPKPKNYCAHNTGHQKVIVSIAKQHAWMCARHRDVFDTAITTGMVGQWTQTPTGNYWIQGRNMNTVLTLNTGAQYDVRYWIPFDAPLFGFHDSSWQHFPYGSPKYKTKGSHGCVHMPLRAMKFLYNWTAQPTQVHIT